jgi:asparagine synthase (glutamine-hydrolysing)
MLMAHSVEGRFPFLDADVMEFCLSLPADYKLRILDEKHLLKRAARGLVPQPIMERTKQPYRAPDAASFAGDHAPSYVHEALSPGAVLAAGIFDPRAVEALHAKVRSRAAGGDTLFSNADNMAFLGVLSTQLVYDTLLRRRPDPEGEAPHFTVDVDRTMTHA